jgi:hypothetical protein
MKSSQSINVLLTAAAVLAASASLARAAEPKVEIGASLASLTIGLGDNDGAVFGVPSGGFGILNPGVYASIFVNPHVAVEPQLGLLWVREGGESEHIVNVAGQIDYFIRGISERSPYLFGAAGLLDVSGSGVTPKSVAGGVGYRVPLGGRLTIRMDGRVTHFTDEGGNSVSFTLAIGGLFGER